MRFFACFRRSAPLLLLLSPPLAHAADERQLANAINNYRAHPTRCEASNSRGLAPLVLRPDVALPIGFAGDMRETLKASGYRAVSVRSLRLAGASNVNIAFDMLRQRYCGALLDTQFADIGITQSGNSWRIVLAKPLLDGHLGDQQSAGRALLAQVNAARAKPRMCGNQRFAATRPLSWNDALEDAAQQHSQSMARASYFAHEDPHGSSAQDRAWAAGYQGRKVGENIASGQGSPDKAMQGWLASPGHCANLMNPMFTQVGAAYGRNDRSKAGVYWTMVFGAQ